MAIGDRIRQVRKEEALTMEEFGKRIGLVKSAVSMAESGTTNVRDQTILSICREFNVSEDWLRTGQGEPRPAMSREEELSAFFSDVTWGDDFKARFVSALAVLTHEDWKYLEQIAQKLVDKNKGGS